MQRRGERFYCPVSNCRRHQNPYVARWGLDGHLNKTHRYTTEMIRKFWREVGPTPGIVDAPVAGPSTPQGTLPSNWAPLPQIAISSIPSSSDSEFPYLHNIYGWDPPSSESSPLGTFTPARPYRRKQADRVLQMSTPSPLRQPFDLDEQPFVPDVQQQISPQIDIYFQQLARKATPVSISRHLRRDLTQARAPALQADQHSLPTSPKAPQPWTDTSGAEHSGGGGRHNSATKLTGVRHTPYTRHPSPRLLQNHAEQWTTFNVVTPESYEKSRPIPRKRSGAALRISPSPRPSIRENAWIKEADVGPRPDPVAHDPQQRLLIPIFDAKGSTEIMKSSPLASKLDPVVRQWSHDGSDMLEAIKTLNCLQFDVCYEHICQGWRELQNHFDLSKDESMIVCYVAEVYNHELVEASPLQNIKMDGQTKTGPLF